jgi:ABC-type phosphate transport system permease subunit
MYLVELVWILQDGTPRTLKMMLLNTMFGIGKWEKHLNCLLPSFLPSIITGLIMALVLVVMETIMLLILGKPAIRPTVKMISFHTNP